jgi:hypothetical protein
MRNDVSAVAKMYQTIPHGVAIPHHGDGHDIPKKDDPRLKPKIMIKIKKSEKKTIRPKQRVESVFIDATNALSAGGQADKIRKTAAMMFLGIEKEIHSKTSQIEFIAHEIDPLEIKDLLKGGMSERQIEDFYFNELTKEMFGIQYLDEETQAEYNAMGRSGKIQMVEDGGLGDVTAEQTGLWKKHAMSLQDKVRGYVDEAESLTEKKEKQEKILSEVKGY